MRALIAALLLCFLIMPAAAHERRHRSDHHHHHHHYHHHHQTHRHAFHHGVRRYSRASEGAPAALSQSATAAEASASASQLVRTALRYVGAKRDPSGFRGEWCGDFMGYVARKGGYRVPVGYRLARSWVKAGPRLRGPTPGAAMVMSHHVGIVLKAQGRSVLLLSGNHGRKVAIGWYPMSSAIAFVRPERG
jgi:uncharacterized protein (TIGR02594 family)